MEQFVFLPLGGSNEIGMNLNAYGFGPEEDRKWIILDIGVTFASEEAIPGVEVILPNPEFLEGEKDNILGIILTHAHEDHIGAIGYLYPRIPAPVYATPFTMQLVRDKLKEKGLDKIVRLNEVELKSSFKLGPFEIEYITLTHSIAEPNGIRITTPLGSVFHTGDWKIDVNPQIGEGTDVKRLKEFGDSGVLAMICDSTNVFEKGESGSEETVKNELIRLVKEEKGKVVIACFASNVARVKSSIEAAHNAGRMVCLMGRSMVRIATAARNIGIIKNVEFIEPEKAKNYKDDEILYLCTGSQGEAKAALSRISEGKHPHLSLKENDTVFFSSREIPGNEKGIFDMINRLALRGVKIVTAHDEHIHVSGHPCRDELAQMYKWIRPQIAIPTHGERRHLVEHSKYALELQVPKTITPKNGDMVLIAPNGPEIIDNVVSGRLYVDGNAILSEDSEAIFERRKIGENGYIMAAICLDQKGRIIGGPDIRTRGLSEKDGSILNKTQEAFANIAEAELKKMKLEQKLDEEYAEDLIVKTLRRVSFELLGKKPMVEVIVMVV